MEGAADDSDQDVIASLVAEGDLEDAFEGEPLMQDGEFDAQDFVHAFQLRHPLAPLFVQEGFTSALKECTTTHMPLLIYLHDDRSQHNARFADMVCSPAVVSVIASYFVAFGYDFTYAAARRRLLQEVDPTIHLSQGLTGEFPCIAVVFRLGGRFQLSRLITATSVDSAQQLAETLEMQGVMFMSQSLQHHQQRHQHQHQHHQHQQSHGAVASADDAPASTAADEPWWAPPKTATERLRAKQDEEYQRSLEADKLKEQQRLEEEEKQRQQEAAEAAEKAAKEQQQQALGDRVRPEPEKGEDCLTIRLYFPENNHATRRFLPDTTVAELVAYVGSQGYLPASYRLQVRGKKVVFDGNESQPIKDLVSAQSIAVLVVPR